MLYVAYGSNMNLEQMAFRCPNAKVIGNGKLKGWNLIFNTHADIIKGERTDEVPVVVWDITDEYDWYTLDTYEGFPSYYVKETVNVILKNGKTEKAIVYVMADDKKGICPPTVGYFECIEDGYIANGIDLKYLYDALERSVDNEIDEVI